MAAFRGSAIFKDSTVSFEILTTAYVAVDASLKRRQEYPQTAQLPRPSIGTNPDNKPLETLSNLPPIKVAQPYGLARKTSRKLHQSVLVVLQIQSGKIVEASQAEQVARTE